MSKKDYILVAGKIVGLKGLVPEASRKLFAETMAGVYVEDNPRFKPEKFFRACEVEPGR